MKKKYIFMVLLILAIILVVVGGVYYFTGAGQGIGPKQDTQSKQIKIGIRLNLGMDYLLFAAEDKEIFKGNGVQVQRVNVPQDLKAEKWDESADKLTKWFNDGGTDAMVMTADEFFMMASNYPNSVKAGTFFYDTDDKYSDFLMKTKDLNVSSIKDLKGKKVAVKGSGVLLSKALETSGASDYQIINVPIDKSWDLVVSEKSAESFWVYEPTYTSLSSKGVARVLEKNPNNSPKNELSGAVTYVIAVRNDYAKNNKDTTKQFFNAINEAMKVDEKQIREVMRKELNNPKIDKIVDDRKYCAVTDSSGLSRDLFQKLSNALFSSNVIKNKINVSDLIFL